MPDQDVMTQPAAPVRQPPIPPAPAAETSQVSPASMNAMQQAISATEPFAKQSAGEISGIKSIREKQAEEAQKTQQELSALPTTQMPEFHQIQPKDASVFFGAMMALGALAGRSTMTPMTAAMNNMTGIMKAQKEGNAEMLAAQKEEFKNNLDAAIAKAKQHAEQRKEILERHNYNMKEADHDLEMLRLEHGIGKDVDNAIRMKYKDIMTAADRLQQRHNAMFKESGGVQLTEDARKMMADMEMQGIKPPNISGRKNVAEEKIRIANEMAEYYKKTGELPNQYGVNQAVQAAHKKTLATLIPRNAAIEQSSIKIEKDIGTLESYLDKGVAGGVKLTNQPLNALRSKFSDPELAQFALATKQVATEYGRMMQGGQLSVAQLHEGAREDAQKLLNESMTIGEIKALLPVIRREIQNQKDSMKQEISDVKREMSQVGGSESTGAKKLPLGANLTPGVHTDKHGNRIEVFSDGTYREM